MWAFNPFSGTLDLTDSPLSLHLDQTAGQQSLTGTFWCDGTSGASPTTGAGTRLMWIPSKFAFRAGKVGGNQWDTIGNGSAAFGENNNIQGLDCAAFGGGNTISSAGDYTFVAGVSNTCNLPTCAILGSGNSIGSQASSGYNTAIGQSNQMATTGQTFSATAIGGSNTVNGVYAVAIGGGCTVDGTAVALGSSCEAYGEGSTAIGYSVISALLGAVAIGGAQQVYGSYGIAIGSECQVWGDRGIAIGWGSITNSYLDMAIGGWASVSSSTYASAMIAVGDYTGGTTLTQDNTLAIMGGIDVKIGPLPFFVGIQTVTPVSMLTVHNGDVEVEDDNTDPNYYGTHGYILTDPNGVRWRVTIDTSGVLQTATV